MANDYYTPSGNPATASSGASAVMRAEFDTLRAAFDKLVGLSGNGGKLVQVNSGCSAQAAAGVVWNSPNNTASIQGNANVAGKLVGTSAMLSPLNGSLSADVALNNTSVFFDGPSVAQGNNGTWFAIGTVTIRNPASGSAACVGKLWDGNTVMATGITQGVLASGKDTNITLSGFITSPTGNIRISVQPLNNTAGKIFANAVQLALGSTITAFRIG